MINEIIIGLAAGIILAIIVNMLIIVKLKKFESEAAKDVLNLVLISMLFYIVLIAFELLGYINMFKVYKLAYLDIILNINTIFIAPIAAICIMACVFVLRDS